jgi:hypothetical protein
MASHSNSASAISVLLALRAQLWCHDLGFRAIVPFDDVVAAYQPTLMPKMNPSRYLFPQLAIVLA